MKKEEVCIDIIDLSDEDDELQCKGNISGKNERISRNKNKHLGTGQAEALRQTKISKRIQELKQTEEMKQIQKKNQTKELRQIRVPKRTLPNKQKEGLNNGDLKELKEKQTGNLKQMKSSQISEFKSVEPKQQKLHKQFFHNEASGMWNDNLDSDPNLLLKRKFLSENICQSHVKFITSTQMSSQPSSSGMSSNFQKLMENFSEDFSASITTEKNSPELLKLFSQDYLKVY